MKYKAKRAWAGTQAGCTWASSFVRRTLTFDDLFMILCPPASRENAIRELATKLPSVVCFYHCQKMMAFLSRIFGKHKPSGVPDSPGEASPEPLQTTKRPITPGETAVLEIVQEEYGPQNTEANVLFTPAKEAHLPVTASDGTMATKISLTDFASCFQRGEVTEQELRNDWIRDSLSVLVKLRETDPSVFRLNARGREGDLVLQARHRSIEIAQDTHYSKGAVEYVLYAKSMRKWEFPFHAEPLTKCLKEEILKIVTRLLEAHGESEGVKVTVRIAW